ncbi:conserved exported hypothetical protein [Bradyrhizobium sp. STM 3843]|uniref:COG3904 family protein n=1 Tax=Bradyrhizobium sp. STM 3843 TaxID=551947 RepID=UPI000240664D|nr:hypothetical protein [Bradyrhizobium sp. STM 3843]CCE04454.1 conserved exported hypothetical protein [Bradyrhizobium sp. STM 3843]
MIQRLILLAALALACAPAGAAPAQRFADHTPPIAFYVVKGPPGVCGEGCDSWIAAEGKIDSLAAARFRKFVKQVGDRGLPIYFNSPGGNLEQGLAIGNILRETKAIARVGRTVVRECGFEAQDGEACVKLKQSGRELTGELWTRGAMCNSACPYLILGAPTREIAPDTLLAVHSPRVILNFSSGAPPAEVRMQALQQANARADRLVLDYLKRMGVDPGLLSVSRSVRFEDLHVLSREEIAKFGVDRREQIETPWTFEYASRGFVYKTVMTRKPGETSFRTTRFQLVCFDADRFELDFQRPAPAASGSTSVAITNGTDRLNFLYPPRKGHDAKGRDAKGLGDKDPGEETWGMGVTGPRLRALASSTGPELNEGELRAGSWQFASSRLSTEGLQAALQRLLSGCPQPKRTSVTSSSAEREQVVGAAR